MNLEVLLSCMHQKDMAIVERSRIQSDVLVINQCDRNGRVETTSNGNRFRMISTTERGLSRSRNKALEHACGDICLICDDDEIFEEGYREAILKAFEENPKADIITFALHHPTRQFPKHRKRLGYIGALQSCSFQIAFRRERVLEKNIRFDVEMGSGAGNGGGGEHVSYRLPEAGAETMVCPGDNRYSGTKFFPMVRGTYRPVLPKPRVGEQAVAGIIWRVGICLGIFYREISPLQERQQLLACALLSDSGSLQKLIRPPFEDSRYACGK